MGVRPRDCSTPPRCTGRDGVQTEFLSAKVYLRSFPQSILLGLVMWGQEDASCFRQGTNGAIKEGVVHTDTQPSRRRLRGCGASRAASDPGTLFPLFLQLPLPPKASEHALQSGKSWAVRDVEATPRKPVAFGKLVQGDEEPQGCLWKLLQTEGRVLSPQTQTKLNEAPVKYLDSPCHSV